MIRGLNNKGFMFIETIIVVVILLTSLLLLYTTYSKVVNKEKIRLYFDNAGYLYKTIAISDILFETIDQGKFSSAVSTSRTCVNASDLNCKYIYLFSINSDIYKSSVKITNARDFFKINRLAYIKIEDIPDLKNCLQGGDDTVKCDNTKNSIAAITYLKDYLLTLDIGTDEGLETYKGREGILVVSFVETKNGGTKIDDGKYQDCIESKVIEHYDLGADVTDSQKKEYLRQYESDDTVNFTMQCENAYYMAWAYLI